MSSGSKTTHKDDNERTSFLFGLYQLLTSLLPVAESFEGFEEFWRLEAQGLTLLRPRSQD